MRLVSQSIRSRDTGAAICIRAGVIRGVPSIELRLTRFNARRSPEPLAVRRPGRRYSRRCVHRGFLLREVLLGSFAARSSVVRFPYAANRLVKYRRTPTAAGCQPLRSRFAFVPPNIPCFMRSRASLACVTILVLLYTSFPKNIDHPPVPFPSGARRSVRFSLHRSACNDSHPSLRRTSHPRTLARCSQARTRAARGAALSATSATRLRPPCRIRDPDDRSDVYSLLARGRIFLIRYRGKQFHN